MHNYSSVERFLYRLAFSNIDFQLVIADIEDKLYSDKLSNKPTSQPVFITALPRAGTTLLLRLLSSQPEFAFHTYREMPFILCPVLWKTFCTHLMRPDAPTPRAHGDGVIVGFDSPEAFEEVLWKAFWPEKYHLHKIRTWSSSDRNEHFEQFFDRHVRKLFFVRSSMSKSPDRYLSKNNANIARLPLLTTLYPDCKILIPFRNPTDHVGSLSKLHQKFSIMQADDVFVRKYMDWLGHYEFGVNLRPIEFGEVFEGQEVFQCKIGDPQFWLRYWIAAYTHISNMPPKNIVLLDYDKFCLYPHEGLAVLSDALELNHPANFVNHASEIRQGAQYSQAEIGTEADRREATALHSKLKAQALF
jgi:hypothetical protein